MLGTFSKAKHENGQKESGRRSFLAMGLVAATWSAGTARADSQDLDARGLTFRDFAKFDNGASFYRVDPTTSPTTAANIQLAKVLSIDKESGMARVRFEPVRIEVGLPLGWQATEDWERGVAVSGDRRYRVIVWRVDFGFEGVRDAEHYAATKTGSIKARRPGIQAQARRLGDGAFVIAYENVPPGREDSEHRAVFDLVVSNPGDPKLGALVTVGVPAGDADRGLSLLALLKSTLSVSW
jgi:hypothetical protein